jgi:hypothetical protein
MNISLDKKYKSNGRLINILCVDRPHSIFPVVGMDDDGTIYYFEKDGKVSESSVVLKSGEVLDDYNLVEVCEIKENEWCWFWDTEEYGSVVLSKFDKMCSNGKFQSKSGTCWKYCSKFNGELPEHFKEI